MRPTSSISCISHDDGHNRASTLSSFKMQHDIIGTVGCASFALSCSCVLHSISASLHMRKEAMSACMSRLSISTVIASWDYPCGRERYQILSTTTALVLFWLSPEVISLIISSGRQIHAGNNADLSLLGKQFPCSLWFAITGKRSPTI